MSPTGARVAICIATADRPVGLRRLLASLPAGIRDAGADVAVVVVDNAAGGAAQLDAGELTALAQRPVTLLREPRSGIPYARNRAMEHAVGAADVLVFVDDDEEVQPNWLRAHLEGLATLHADVTVGPVVPIMPASASAWAADGDFHRGLHLASGAVMHTAPTGNTAIRAAVIAGVTPWFDPSLAKTGGSDSEYFERVTRAGHRIVWVEQARVHEHVPPERARLGWVLRRAYRVGAVGSMISRSRSRSRSAEVAWPPASWPLAVGAVRGSAHVAAGLSRATIGLAKSRQVAIAGLAETAHGLGILAGLIGLRPRRYH